MYPPEFFPQPQGLPPPKKCHATIRRGLNADRSYYRHNLWCFCRSNKEHERLDLWRKRSEAMDSKNI